MPVLLLKLLATLYALLVLLGGLAAADDSSALGYPTLIVMATAIAHVALALGIVSLTYRWYPAWVKHYWKPTFIFCVVDLLVGLAMDASIPNDYSLSTNGAVWLLNTTIIVALLAPAFYLNYKLAFHRYG